MKGPQDELAKALPRALEVSSLRSFRLRADQQRTVCRDASTRKRAEPGFLRTGERPSRP